jgi:UDP-N-acetylmuramate dehydrogenase
MNQYDAIKPFGQIRRIHLASSTWFRVGGYAHVFKPHDNESLCDFLKQNSEPLTILGATSNILVRDLDIPGIVIKLGRSFASMSAEDGCIIAGGACFDRDVAYFAANLNLSGLEFLVGIPGMIGGAVFMNAGAYGSDIASCLLWVDIVTKDGNLVRLKGHDIPMEYRKGNLPQGSIVVKAAFKATPKDHLAILKTMQDFLEKREQAQPIKARTGGSTFKNPKDHFAWQLIDKAKCRGLCLGDAQVSEKHCNFLINKGSARAHDLETLGEMVRKRVFEESGIWLEWEIKRIGSCPNQE